MAAIILFQNREIRPHRIFRERINPLLYMNDQEVEERYRIPRAGIEELIQMIEDGISPICTRSHALDAPTKVSIDTKTLYLLLVWSLGSNLYLCTVGAYTVATINTSSVTSVGFCNDLIQ